MAAEGHTPHEVVRKAEAAAAGWRRRVRGGLAPDRLALVGQALLRLCRRPHACRLDRLNRAGQPGAAQGAAQRAQALDGTQQALRACA